MRKRAILAIVDQGVLSLSSLGLSIVVARTSSVETFSAFSIVAATHIILTGFRRAVFGDPLVVRFSKTKDDRLLSSSLVLSLCSAAVFAAVAISSSFAFKPVLKYALVSYSVSLPILLLQDSLRYNAIVLNQYIRLLVSDIVLAAVVLISIIFYSKSVTVGDFRIDVVIFIWGVAAAVSCTSFTSILHRIVKTFSTLVWDRKTRRLSKNLGADYLAYAIGQQSAPFIAASITTILAAGAIRGAQVLLGPLNVVSAGLGPVMLAHASERADEANSVRVLCMLFGAGLLATAGLAGAVIAFLPLQFGERILGATWPLAASVAFPIAISMGLNAGGFAASVGLRARERVDINLKLRLLTMPVGLILVPVATMLFGLTGAVYGMLISSVIIFVTWWSALLVELRRN